MFDDPTGESLERAPCRSSSEIAGKDHEIDIPSEECLAHRFIDTIRIERVGVEDEVLHARRDRLRRNRGAGLGGHQQHDLASQSAVLAAGGEMPERAPGARREDSEPGGLLWLLAHDRA